MWVCRCDCGATSAAVRCTPLTAGRIVSCGCLRMEKLLEIRTTHGDTKGGNTCEYSTWCHIKQRCHNPDDPAYFRYGGRGIHVCRRWMDSFVNFLNDMGRRPTKFHSIERLNNNGNYSPSNCKWATKWEQMRNTRANRFFQFEGEKRTMAEIARMLGIRWQRLSYHIGKRRTIPEIARRFNYHQSCVATP